GDLRVGQALLLHAFSDAGLDRRGADPAATRLAGGRVKAYFDHEWHPHDSELLRAKRIMTRQWQYPIRSEIGRPSRHTGRHVAAALRLVPPPHRATGDCAL